MAAALLSTSLALSGFSFRIRSRGIGSFWICFVVLISLAASPALADTVIVKSGTAQGLPFTNVRVTRVQDDFIFFITPGGREVSKDLKTVTLILLDDEIDLNAGENAFTQGKWTEACDAYLKVLSTTSKAWLRDWCSVRLTTAGPNAHRFDAAAAGYVQQVLKDPAAAAANKPKVPDGTTYLDTAEVTVKDALKSINGKKLDAQKQALLSFLLEIEQARKDTRAAEEIANQLMSFRAAAGDPTAAKVLVEGILAKARADVDQKKFDDAAALIKENSAVIVEPGQQAESLFILAQVQENKAANGSENGAWEETALAYLRVVANFKDQSQNPRIAQALLAAAAALEKAKDSTDALRLYQQVAESYKGTAAATEAARSAARLSASGPSPN